MALLDQKGRLFGKVNIIDAMIIFIFIVLLPAFFQVYKIMGRAPVRVRDIWVEVEGVSFLMPESAGLIKIGDISYDEFGEPDGRILKVVEKEDSYTRSVKTIHNVGRGRDREMENSEYKNAYYIWLELLCTKSSKNEPYYYKRLPMEVSLDKPIQFTSKRYRLLCFLTKIKG